MASLDFVGGGGKGRAGHILMVHRKRARLFGAGGGFEGNSQRPR